MDATTGERAVWQQRLFAEGRVVAVERGDTGQQHAAQLLCFPAAGGGIAALQATGSALPDDLAVSIVEGPGHTLTRGPPLCDVQELADLYARALPIDPRRCVLVGHSFGALLAFELAGRWEEQGSPCAGIVLAACRPPWTAERRLSELSDAELVEWSFEVRDHGPATARERRAAAFIVGGLRADLIAYERFRARRLNVTPALIVAGADDAWCSLECARAWTESATNVEFRTVRGGHFFPRSHPDELARLIHLFVERCTR